MIQATSIFCVLLGCPLAVAQFVVTLGDGYASGAGIYNRANEYDSPECLRVNDEVPGAIFAEKYGMQHINLACQSSLLVDVERELDSLQTIYPEHAAQNFTGWVIFLTVGLNDLRNGQDDTFRDMIRRCQRLPACHKQDSDFLEFQNTPRLISIWERTLHRLATEFQGAAVGVMNYPRIFVPNRACAVSGIRAAEAEVLDNAISSWNDAINERVLSLEETYEETGWSISIISNSFQVSGACQRLPFSRTMHGNHRLVPFYPTKRGYDELSFSVEYAFF